MVNEKIKQILDKLHLASTIVLILKVSLVRIKIV